MTLLFSLQNIVGTGFPEALHTKRTFWSSKMDLFLGGSMILGASCWWTATNENVLNLSKGILVEGHINFVDEIFVIVMIKTDI